MAGYSDSSREDLTPPLPEPGELTETQRGEFCDRALEQAERLRRNKRPQEGIDLLVEVLKYGQRKPLIYFRLGNIYFDSGDLSRAEYAYKRTIDEDPHHASAHHNLGVVYRKRGRVSQSVQYLKKARRLEIRHPRRAELSDQQKRAARRTLLPLSAVPLLILVAIVIIVLLLSRFT